MKFSPRRWRLDEKLRMCSVAARGAWMELICIMHEAEPYGHLLVAGKPPNDRMLSVMTGIPIIELSTLLHELEENEVFSRNKDGVVFSRAMVRDEEAHIAAVNFGNKGVEAKRRKSQGEKPPSRAPSTPPSRGASRLESESEEESERDPSVVSPPTIGEKTELPFDWVPGPFGDDSAAGKIVSGWTAERLEREAESFRAHHRRKHSRYSDWQDTWGTWVRNAKGFDDRNDRVTQAAPAPSYAEIVLREAEQREASQRTKKPPKARRKAAAR